MNIVTSRFGLVPIQESEIIRIPDGLVGFRSFTQYRPAQRPRVVGFALVAVGHLCGSGLRA